MYNIFDISFSRLWLGFKKFAVFFVSIIACYNGIYHIAFESRERAMNDVRNRTNSVIAQADLENWQIPVSMVPDIQNTNVPRLPDFKNPISVFQSFFEKYNSPDEVAYHNLRDLIQRKKDKLNNMKLTNLVLSLDPELITDPRADFRRSNFASSNLSGGKFDNLNFLNSNLFASILDKSSFNSSNLSGVSFAYAFLENTSFKHSSLVGADMKNAWLAGAKFHFAKMIDVKFDSSYILYTDFEDASLYGSDLSMSNIDDGNNNFVGAKYNSCVLSPYELRNMESVVDRYAIYKCAAEESWYRESCHRKIRDRAAISFVTKMKNLEPTKFPKDFNPKAHGMVDITEIVHKMREYNDGYEELQKLRNESILD